jgi:hypothetical protein
MRTILAVLMLATLTACSTSTHQPSPANTGQAALVARINAIQGAITDWSHATTLAQAQTAAETARNLVVGSHGPDYGDANHDRTTEGAATEGLLPGLRGEAGLAEPGHVSACVTADVLGGSWTDPNARWAQAEAAVAAWTPTNNTFPALMSQPQRIYGWASLTLKSTTLATAIGYATDAQMHIDSTRAAIEHCPS